MGKIAGNWQGIIQMPSQSLPIKIRFSEQSASISIPEQGITNHPLTNIRFDETSLYFKMNIQNQQLLAAG